MRRRIGAGAFLATAVAVTALAVSTAPVATATTTILAPWSPGAKNTLVVGAVTLKACAVVPGAYCGSIKRAWDPTGAVRGAVTVGFAYAPARDVTRPALGTVVPHEGGPGYSTTGTATSYAQMYGPLLDRRNLLLVDQRGTGLSQPVDCPTLQNLTGAYAPAAATCAKSLGDHANLYGSALSADDLAAVIGALRLGPVDLYGDSYGTFFAQVFAGRHGDVLRSLVVDSAYPTYGENAWYGTQGPAMQSSIDKICARTPGCTADGRTTSTLLVQVLAQVRRTPYRGAGYDADGIRHQVVVDGPALVGVAFGATYGPAWYRELPGALRSALAGDRAPLLRLVAEADYASGGGGAPAAYSEGLDAAVACHDYPQLYDMTAPPAKRMVEFAAAVRAKAKTDPGVYAPFTVGEYLSSGWEEQDWCLRWPVAPAAHPAGPPVPLSGAYPAVPTLVLSGELDSITTPAEGALVAAQFPNAVQVHVANSFHVTAAGDTDVCAVLVLRSFVEDPAGGLTPSVLACTSAVPAVRGVTAFTPSYLGVAAATGLPGSLATTSALRAAHAGALTVADVIDRWYNNSSGAGVGLYGGTFTSSGNRTTTFQLKGMRLEKDLAVSGTVVWGMYTHQVMVQLTVTVVDGAGHAVPGPGVDGTVSGSWDTRAPGAVANLAGRLGGRVVVASVVAP